ncbi:lysophospholipid acyltransferase family protein [Marinospirillum sp. MEB164]|uniref:Lysophospholipid acyltransferase family protein n=1 Tax=Marinospirillum alkalitolerans TaxID=3123374 RepID=A0ABW8PXN2_9GAMM
MARDKYSHPVKAWWIRLGWRLMGRLPLVWIQRLGQWAGRLTWRFSERERHVSQVNVELCFPHKTPWERDQLARSALIESAKTMLEMGRMWLAPPQKLLKSVVKVEGYEVIAQLQAEQKPVILLGPHIGQWEIISLWFAQRHPFMAMFAPSKVRELDPLIKSGRERTGARLVPTDVKGVAALLKSLKKGGAVGILPDQEPDAGQGGVFAPFFGVPALTATLLPKLVSRTQAQVFTALARRLPNGQGYELIFEPADARVYAEDEQVAAAGVNASVEALIAHAPSQYQWAYKRFRQRPEGESKVY